MNHEVKTNSKGFTLIELMLAMTFISVLLLAIAMSVIQIGNIYNKGITVKDINQSGRAIADDVARTAGEAAALSIPRDLQTNSAGGRLCFGNYSYIWNTAQAIENNDANLMKFESDENRPITLIKVPDSTKRYCALDATDALLYTSVRELDTETSQELLPGGDHKLGINRFDIPATSQVSDTTIKQSLYTLHYTLGSGAVSAMTIDQSACLGPTERNSNLTYCSVQQFTLVLKTGNRV